MLIKKLDSIFKSMELDCYGYNYEPIIKDEVLRQMDIFLETNNIDEDNEYWFNFLVSLDFNEKTSATLTGSYSYEKKDYGNLRMLGGVTYYEEIIFTTANKPEKTYKINWEDRN